MTADPTDLDKSLIGAHVLDALRALMIRYVVLPSPSAIDATVLWIAATHGVNCWEHATRLVIKSPEKRCGKSRLLDVIEATCARPLMTINASTAAIFRSIGGSDQPTLLVDEADSIFGTRIKADQNEDLRGLLNAGFGRGRPVLRTVGPQHTVTDFPTFAMAALAGIGDLPDTIEDRAINLRMRRRAANEWVQPFRQRRDLPELHKVRDQLADWMRDMEPKLRDAEPENPLEDRAADLWEPLLSVADAAGGRWPAAARSAAVVMAADSEDADSDRSLGMRLLADIKELFDRHQVGFMTSADLTNQLRQLADSPWADLDLTARRLSVKLKPYGISPGHNTSKSERGYQRALFTDAWHRYPTKERPQPFKRPKPPDTKGSAADTSPATDRSIRPTTTSSSGNNPHNRRDSDARTSRDATQAPDFSAPPSDVRTLPDATPPANCSECQRRYVFGSGRCHTHSPKLATA